MVSLLENELLDVVREKTVAKEMCKRKALENTFAKKYIGTQILLRKQLDRLKLGDGKRFAFHSKTLS